MFINFFRAFVIGLRDLKRNFGLFLGSAFVLFLTLFIITLATLLQKLTQNLILTLKNKADIAVYFLSDAEEGKILELKSQIEKTPGVSEVKYISKEEALEEFKKKRANDPLLAEALEIIGSNPLPASLLIKAQSVEAFENVAKFLNQKKDEYKIEKLNYSDVKSMIEKLFSISKDLRFFSILIGGILGFIAFFMIFYTIRLSIYSRREEIKAMRLIGATNWFIRGPFLFQGMILGLISGLLTFFLFFGIAQKFSPKTFGFLGEIGLIQVLKTNLLNLFELNILAGIFLATFATFFAIQKYLKV
jgi:cell division transport system permease protein